MRGGLFSLFCCLALLALLVPAAATPVLDSARVASADGARAEEIVAVPHQIESFDGIVLDTLLWYNASLASGARPVVLAAHGWAQDKSAVESRARWLADLGYVVLAWDARGFGASGGTVGLNGPDEWRDVSALVDWVALRADEEPRILLDAADDPRLGMVGSSYGGAIQLLAAAQDARIDAIVPDITWNDLLHSLAPNGVVKRGWLDLLYWSGIGSSYGVLNAQPNDGGMDERLTQWYLETWQTGDVPGDALDALAERSPARYLEGLDAHVLLMQGWMDTLFWPGEAAATFEALRARPDAATHLIFRPAGHGHSLTEAEEAQVRDFAQRFLARHLLDDEEATLPAVVYHAGASGNWTESASWPPAETVKTVVPLRGAGGATSVELLQVHVPTTVTEMQEFQGQNPFPHWDVADGITSAVLETAVLGPVSLVGRPVVFIAATSEAARTHLFLSLIETGESSGPRVLYHQVTPVRFDTTGRIALEVPLSDLAHTVPAGRELRLRVATSDAAYFGARESGAVTLHLEEASLVLPLAQPAGVPVRAHVPADLAEETPVPLTLLFVLIAGALVHASRLRQKRRCTKKVKEGEEKRRSHT